MSNKAVIVFTYKSLDRILEDGGTSAWRLDRNHARSCDYAVCTRNAHSEHSEGREPHRSAFLVGKVKDVVPSKGREGRFIVLFSEYAEVDIPDAWKGDRNPVSYGKLSDLGITPSALNWQPMPVTLEPEPAPEIEHKKVSVVPPLTMAEAKLGLAKGFDVSPDCIEITIKG